MRVEVRGTIRELSYFQLGASRQDSPERRGGRKQDERAAIRDVHDEEWLQKLLMGTHEMRMVAAKTSIKRLTTSDAVKMLDNKEYVFERQPVPHVKEVSWMDMLEESLANL